MSAARTQIAPSILAADYAAFGEAARAIENAGADAIHIDIMDGHFVPNISFGSQLVRDLRAHSALFFDVHLMIDPYEPYLESFAQAGANGITIHLEASGDMAAALQRIASWGLRAGVAINPSTSVAQFLAWHEQSGSPKVEQIVVMTVEPGFGGQTLLPHTLDKIKQLRAAWKDDILLVADGGVTSDNAASVRAAGANVLVAGTAFFAKRDKKMAIQQLKGEASDGASGG